MKGQLNCHIFRALLQRRSWCERGKKATVREHRAVLQRGSWCEGGNEDNPEIRRDQMFR